METELTKNIKRLTHSYRPKLNTNMRTIRWADEVWTDTGIVDSIRFEDYYASDKYICRLLEPEYLDESYSKNCEHGKCFRDSSPKMDPKKCRACVFKSHTYEVGMMITCFEVKITYADFKSPNGHNFHGNENYYCVPKKLAPKIAPEVPEDIGILAYWETEKGCGLRQYKPARWREVADDVKVRLLYNAMKKVCDRLNKKSEI